MRLGFCVAFLLLTTSLFAQELKLPPGITKEKAAEGWIALFDGETLYGVKTEGNVKLSQGIITLDDNKEASLTTKCSVGSFELAFQYRLEGKLGAFEVRTADGQIGKEDKTSVPSVDFKDFSMAMPAAKKAGPLTIAIKPGTVMHIKSIALKPLDSKPLFNGKDLTGWKEIPGRKSKFSVTSAGELNVKDGNGDLQTVDQWDNFVLQMDIISNGDHLNSGVFFRCLPGEFWSGYEAQVRNEWQSTVQLKNGQVHTGSVTRKGEIVEVIAKGKKLTFQSSELERITDHRDKPIDFGSGGIYNKTPSRRVVSTDREYYTMTVIAHGNHLAVWVNGYQTAEYTDNSQPSKSARRGRKDDAGPISIQGHDPTTDLSFKNIRIASLPK